MQSLILQEHQQFGCEDVLHLTDPGLLSWSLCEGISSQIPCLQHHGLDLSHMHTKVCSQDPETHCRMQGSWAAKHCKIAA